MNITHHAKRLPKSGKRIIKTKSGRLGSLLLEAEDGGDESIGEVSFVNGPTQLRAASSYTDIPEQFDFYITRVNIIVREDMDLKSARVGKLSQLKYVRVDEIQDRRARIDWPMTGWCTYEEHGIPFLTPVNTQQYELEGETIIIDISRKPSHDLDSDKVYGIYPFEGWVSLNDSSSKHPREMDVVFPTYLLDEDSLLAEERQYALQIHVDLQSTQSGDNEQFQAQDTNSLSIKKSYPNIYTSPSESDLLGDDSHSMSRYDLASMDSASFSGLPRPLSYRRAPSSSVLGKFADDTGHTQINQYVLGEQLGKGSYGTVFEGHDYITLKSFAENDLTEKVAIKIINVEPHLKRVAFVKNGYDNVFRDLQEEADFMRQLCHPNLTGLKEYMTDKTNLLHNKYPGKLYLVMEYANNGTLQDMIEANHDGLTEKQFLSYFVQIISGLHYLHSKRAVHCDLKPANILLKSVVKMEQRSTYTNDAKRIPKTDDGGDTIDIVKICDFGVSTKFADFCESFLDDFRTSPYYQAPETTLERLEQSKAHGYPTDIYAAGLVAVQLFTGKSIDIIVGHIGEHGTDFDVANLTDGMVVEPELIDLLNQMLQHEPSARVTAGQIIDSQYYSNHRNDINRIMEAVREHDSFSIAKRGTFRQVALNMNSLASLSDYSDYDTSDDEDGTLPNMTPHQSEFAVLRKRLIRVETERKSRNMNAPRLREAQSDGTYDQTNVCHNRTKRNIRTPSQELMLKQVKMELTARLQHIIEITTEETNPSATANIYDEIAV